MNTETTELEAPLSVHAADPDQDSMNSTLVLGGAP
jgi:hypothetical protein